MKKFIGILCFSFAVAGCSSKGSHNDMLYDAAAACNTVCKANPAVSQVSNAAGGGFPVLFLGTVETSCTCKR